MTQPTRRSNAKIALPLVAIVLGMTGLAFASVPLYRVFCQVTGFGGTTQVAEEGAGQVLERKMTIRFNADVDPDLPWGFVPEQKAVEVKVGEQGLAFYRAVNHADQPIAGTAVYNVTPNKAGLYFSKIHCFCFDEQRLDAGEAVDMPVTFFVDPAIADDPNLDDVKTITLSYTFFRARTPAAPARTAAANDRPSGS